MIARRRERILFQSALEDVRGNIWSGLLAIIRVQYCKERQLSPKKTVIATVSEENLSKLPPEKSVIATFSGDNCDRKKTGAATKDNCLRCKL